jgi:hypothetical protein
LPFKYAEQYRAQQREIRATDLDRDFGAVLVWYRKTFVVITILLPRPPRRPEMQTLTTNWHISFE